MNATDIQPINGLVFMCSGQGSQKPGMGASLFNVPEVAAAFECASDILGRDIAALVAEEDAEVSSPASASASAALNETRNAQAAIATLSIGIARALMARGIQPSVLLGFSLGQISALALSGMLTDEEAFALIDVRSRVMDEAARATAGAMSALLKADIASVESLCKECSDVETGDVVYPANYNCPGQIVVGGTLAAIERAEEAWKSQGGRASRLATQGAFHTPLMQQACKPYADYLAGVDFKKPTVPVLCNTDATFVDEVTVRQRLVDHLTHPVKFQQSVELLIENGNNNFCEVGFGGVLSGLIKRVNADVVRTCVQDAASFDEFIDTLNSQRKAS